MCYTLTDEDILKINVAKAKVGNKLWKDPDLEYLRENIKLFYISKPLALCCYCSRNLHGEFRMVIDIEHILPKKKFKDLTYEPKNLNISCKRCNLNYKKDKIDFIDDITIMGADYFHSNHYKFLHPNLDNYNDHLDLNVFQFNKYRYIKYRIINNSKKGNYTYKYFGLNNLEIKCIDNAQGIQDDITLSDKIKGQLRIALINILIKI